MFTELSHVGSPKGKQETRDANMLLITFVDFTALPEFKFNNKCRKSEF